MRYVLWAAFAMVSYSFVFLFGKLAMEELPAFTVMTIAVSFVMVASVLVTAATGDWQLTSVTDTHVLFAYAAGLTLTGAVVGYFRALSTGPASVVVPIYGMFIAGGAILGILVLNEPASPKKLLGLGLATVAVLLISS
ncbi:multidrug transporter [Halobacteriales archaeon QS_5_70_15]|nr:MAG: multidrug transporter [Halobacteriales archaeon QS_5_70_15]